MVLRIELDCLVAGSLCAFQVPLESQHGRQVEVKATFIRILVNRIKEHFQRELVLSQVTCQQPELTQDCLVLVI